MHRRIRTSGLGPGRANAFYRLSYGVLRVGPFRLPGTVRGQARGPTRHCTVSPVAGGIPAPRRAPPGVPMDWSKTQRLQAKVGIRLRRRFPGDGMQLHRHRDFTKAAAGPETAISTFPDFRSEIRGPRRRWLFGVSGFQRTSLASEIHTPGDAPALLVSDDGLARKTSLRKDLIAPAASSFADCSAFIDANLKKANRDQPASGRSLASSKLYTIDIRRSPAPPSDSTELSTEEVPVEELLRAFDWCSGCTAARPRARSRIRQQFAKKPGSPRAENIRCSKAGYHNERLPGVPGRCKVPPAKFAPPACTRHPSNSKATRSAWWSAPSSPTNSSSSSQLPITPASSVSSLAKYKNYNCDASRPGRDRGHATQTIGASSYWRRSASPSSSRHRPQGQGDEPRS